MAAAAPRAELPGPVEALGGAGWRSGPGNVCSSNRAWGAAAASAFEVSVPAGWARPALFIIGLAATLCAAWLHCKACGLNIGRSSRSNSSSSSNLAQEHPTDDSETELHPRQQQQQQQRQQHPSVVRQARARLDAVALAGYIGFLAASAVRGSFVDVRRGWQVPIGLMAGCWGVLMIELLHPALYFKHRGTLLAGLRLVFMVPAALAVAERLPLVMPFAAVPGRLYPPAAVACVICRGAVWRTDAEEPGVILQLLDCVSMGTAYRWGRWPAFLHRLSLTSYWACLTCFYVVMPLFVSMMLDKVLQDSALLHKLLHLHLYQGVSVR